MKKDPSFRILFFVTYLMRINYLTVFALSKLMGLARNHGKKLICI